METDKSAVILDYVYFKVGRDWILHKSLYANLKRRMDGNKYVFRQAIALLLEEGMLVSKEERVNSNRSTRFYRLTKKAIDSLAPADQQESSLDSGPLKPVPQEGYLYIMYETKAKTIKIGKSENAPKREQQLNSTKMPMRVYLVAQVRSPYYAEAEKILHDLYDQYCVDPYETSKRKTEWFDLSPTEMACLMLLTPFHLEEMVVRRNIPRKSLTELIDGALETFMNPVMSLTENQSNRREAMIGQLHQVIKDKNDKIRRYEQEITRLKMEQELEDNGISSTVRSALRSLPESYSASHGNNVNLQNN
jgi:hypothetical protein